MFRVRELMVSRVDRMAFRRGTLGDCYADCLKSRSIEYIRSTMIRVYE